MRKTIALLTSFVLFCSAWSCAEDEQMSSVEQSTFTTVTTQIATVVTTSAEPTTEPTTKDPTDYIVNWVQYNNNLKFSVPSTCKKEFTEDKDAIVFTITDDWYFLYGCNEATYTNNDKYVDKGLSEENTSIFETSANEQLWLVEYYDDYSIYSMYLDGFIHFFSFYSPHFDETFVTEILETVSENPDYIKPKTDEEIEAEYKNSCQSLSYKDIARDKNGLEGEFVTFTGEIIQVVDDNTYRMNVTKEGEYITYYTDAILLYYDIGDGNRILEGDIITIWGKCGGLYTYEAVLGNNITVPLIYAEYAELIE